MQNISLQMQVWCAKQKKRQKAVEYVVIRVKSSSSCVTCVVF